MPLNKSKGNMYPFVNRIWNPVKGECQYRCGYCYVPRIFKRFGKEQPKLYLDEAELRKPFGVCGATIFVCDSTDLFAPKVRKNWVFAVFDKAVKVSGMGNRLLWHTKNPARFFELLSEYMEDVDNNVFVDDDALCVTVESNRTYKDTFAPPPLERLNALQRWAGDRMITIEPIMDFDLDIFLKLIKNCKPDQVNIGADSGRNNLPEPPKEKILELIAELEKFTRVFQKKNLGRLLK
jgi:DNA repair photolyase